MKLDQTMEVAYPRKYVENIIIGLEDPLNQDLVKLIGFDFPAEQRGHFRREVRTWLAKIQRLRMKPDSRTGSFKFYYDFLFDYPFVGVEIQNMRHDGPHPRGIRSCADQIARGTRRVASAISHPTCRSPSPRPGRPRCGPGLAPAGRSTPGKDPGSSGCFLRSVPRR
jgi:hypothetical protein